MALKRIWIPSPNYSSRGGSGVRLVVVHTAEGARSFRDLGGFFGSSSSGVSSHVGIDDERGTIGEYVARANKAWTQGNFNPQCVSVELCAAPIQSGQPCGASWDTAEWNRHEPMLANVAEWIAEECAHYGIPIEKLSASQAQGSGHGVCGHVDLGTAGGNHSDPGPNFPWSKVMDMARGGVGSTPTPEQEEDQLIASVLSHSGTLNVFELADGYVWDTWQRKNETSWNGGKEGSGPAGMRRFCEAKDVVSIAAETSEDGTIHLFGRKKNGSTVFTFQKPNQTAWSGGEAGKCVAAFRGFAPAP